MKVEVGRGFKEKKKSGSMGHVIPVRKGRQVVNKSISLLRLRPALFVRKSKLIDQICMKTDTNSNIHEIENNNINYDRFAFEGTEKKYTDTQTVCFCLCIISNSTILTSTSIINMRVFTSFAL